MRVALVTFSMALSLLGVEIILTGFYGQLGASRSEIAKELGVEFDPRSVYQVYSDLRALGLKAVPNIARSAILGRFIARFSNGRTAIPLGGVSNVSTIFCNESGAFVFYLSDEHGFNNPKGVHGVVPISIAAVGDSFTQGLCVEREDSAIGIVRKTYGGVVNLGMAGNGPLSMLATLKEYALFQRPKIVLWLYFSGNDIADLENEKRHPVLTPYVNSRTISGIRRYQDDLDRGLEELVRETAARRVNSINSNAAVSLVQGIQESKLLHLFLLSRLRNTISDVLIGRVKPVVRVDVTMFDEILADAKRTVEGWNGKMYFVYLPSWRDFADPYDFHEVHDRVLKIVKKNGLVIVDMYEVFSERDPLGFFVFRRPGHYNKAGYRLVGETLVDTLSREEFTDPDHP